MPGETATFVLSLKQPIFNAVRRENASDPAALFDDIWRSTQLVDKLALKKQLDEIGQMREERQLK